MCQFSPPTFLCLFALLLLFADDSISSTYKFPVRRLDSSHVHLHRKTRLANNVYRKVNRILGLYRNSPVTLHSKYQQNVYDYYDLEYIATMSIGTPAQEFEVVLDTGSANLWIPDSSCDSKRSCDKWCNIPFYCELHCDDYCCWGYGRSKGSSCDNKHKFHSEKSMSYIRNGKDFQIIYGTGFVDGFLGMDTVRFGAANDSTALTIPNTFVGQVTTMGRFFHDLPFDGICGLAFTSIAADGVLPPLMNALNQGMLDLPMFTVYLETEGVEAVNKKGGMFTWGGRDEVNCGPIEGWTPLTHETYYEFEIQDVAYGHKYSTNRTQKAISDTGTSLIIGNTNMVKAIAREVGGSIAWDAEVGMYMLPCDQHYDPITFTINGKQYSLPKEVLTISAGEKDRPNLCMFGMVPYEAETEEIEPAWILGDPFIRQYCNVYDIGNKRIGFALARHR